MEFGKSLYLISLYLLVILGTFLEAQLLSNYIDVTDSLRPSLTHGTFSYNAHISVVVDRFERSLRFCYLEFDMEAISDICRSENAQYRWGFCILSDFRQLSFCGPCGLFFIKIKQETIKLNKSTNYKGRLPNKIR